MPVPPINGTKKANKGLYLLRSAHLRHRYLRERLPSATAHQLATRDDVKYVFVRMPHRRLDALNGQLNGLIKEIKTHIEAPSLPSRVDFDALLDGRPMGLFEIVRLHECLTSPALMDTGAEKVLLDFQLRKGLPEQSVVAAVRVFDPDTFDELQRRAGGIREIAKEMAAETHKELGLIETAISTMKDGYPWRDEGGATKRGRYRISNRQAIATYNALVRVADGKFTLPPLDAVFSRDQRLHPIGTRLGTKPLERAEGAFY